MIRVVTLTSYWKKIQYFIIMESQLILFKLFIELDNTKFTWSMNGLLC